MAIVARSGWLSSWSRMAIAVRSRVCWLSSRRAECDAYLNGT